MGYITNAIADITEPKVLTLSALTNFVEFRSNSATVKVPLEVNIQVNAVPATDAARTLLNVTQPSGDVNSFIGTHTIDDAVSSIFYIAAATANTAENLRQALLSNAWLKANFEITVPSVLVGAFVQNGSIVNIKSKGYGSDFNITIAAPNNVSNSAYTITWVHATSVNGDSISGEESTAEIDLDIYTDPQVLFGTDDKPTTAAKIGTYSTTLSKTYAGLPLWFELNALNAQYGAYNKPPVLSGWFNTGTARVFRFAARVAGANNLPFYQSNALFVINGYSNLSDPPQLSQYTYKAGEFIKLLTNRPRTSYMRGQVVYLNYIQDFSGANYNLQIVTRVYTTSDVYLGTVYSNSQSRDAMRTVNTCKLTLNSILDTYPTAGIIRVALAVGTNIVSEDIEFQVRPECLHKLAQFTFLNKLGGWDNFNFDAAVQNDIKTKKEMYSKTVTPSYGRGSSQETVYTAEIDNTYTIEGAPVTDEVAEWLKELAASKVVFDAAGNYIIVDELTLRTTAASFNMQVPTMKYRLSETYTND